MDDGFENWEEVLGPMASAYRNSVHSSTMEIPYFLITARDPSMVIYRFLIPEKELITPQDYKSQTMKRQREGFNLVKRNLLDARRQQKIQYDRRAKEEKFESGDRVLLDVRKTKLGTSKKLNPRYQGPFRISKVFPNHTVEIRTYNGNGTQLTHVNRLKILTECMIWRDEESVDFDDLRELKLGAERPGEENTEVNGVDNNEDSLKEEEIDEVEEEEIDEVEEEETEEEEEEINQKSMERETVTTQNKESVDEPQKISDKGERRSGRASRLPDKFRDFVLD